MNTPFRLSWLLLFVSTATISFAAPQSEFLDLGTTSGTYPSAHDGLSGDGGDLLFYDAGRRLWRHDSGLSPIVIAGVSDVRGMSENGRDFIVSIDVSAGGTSAFRPAVWSATNGINMLNSPPVGALDRGWANNITPDGQFVVGHYELSGISNPYVAAEEAFLWGPGGTVQLLGDLPGEDYASVAIAISDDGQVVVGRSVTGHAFTPNGHWPIWDPFVWTQQTGMVPMPSAPYRFSAGDISANGRVVVGSAIYWDINGNEAQYATRVEMGVSETPIYFEIPSQATSVSADGRVVIGTTRAYGLTSEIFVWIEGQGAQRLEDYLLAHGASGVTGWRLFRTFGLSYDGNTIAGLGTDPNGQSRAFVAYLNTPSLELGTPQCAPAAVNSTGSVGQITASGFGYLEHGALRLTASDLPPGVTTLFLCSTTAGLTPMPGGSQGTLCLGGALGRFNDISEFGVTDASGQFSLDVNLQSFPHPSGRIPVLAGETWHFQAWHRDANPSPTSNLTGSVSELFE